MSNASVLFDAPGPKARRRYQIISVITVVAIVTFIAVTIWRFQTTGQLEYSRWEPFVTPAYMEVLLEGLLSTLQIAALAIVGALVFGVVFSVGKLSDHAWVRWPSWLVVEFFRAVPLLMLIIFLWAALFRYERDIIAPLVIALILYNGSVLAETFRAGMNAVPKGQVEAAYALGMRKNAVMRLIQLPQAIRIMLPALVSQCVVALKDTSLGYYILAPGLTTVGRRIWGEFGNYLQTAIVLAILYIVMNLALTWLANLLERRLNKSEAASAKAAALMADPGRAV